MHQKYNPSEILLLNPVKLNLSFLINQTFYHEECMFRTHEQLVWSKLNTYISYIPGLWIVHFKVIYRYLLVNTFLFSPVLEFLI